MLDKIVCVCIERFKRCDMTLENETHHGSIKLIITSTIIDKGHDTVPRGYRIGIESMHTT